jgi:hypothetical protein
VRWPSPIGVASESVNKHRPAYCSHTPYIACESLGAEIIMRNSLKGYCYLDAKYERITDEASSVRPEHALNVRLHC